MRQGASLYVLNVHVMWVLITVAVVFVLWGAVLAYRWARLKAEVGEIYEAKRAHGELQPHGDEARFEAAYMGPKRPGRPPISSFAPWFRPC